MYGVATLHEAFNRQFAGIRGVLAARARITAQIAPNHGLLTHDTTCDLRDVVLRFHVADNLASISLDKVSVAHRVTSTYRTEREAFNA